MTSSVETVPVKTVPVVLFMEPEANKNGMMLVLDFPGKEDELQKSFSDTSSAIYQQFIDLTEQYNRETGSDLDIYKILVGKEAQAVLATSTFVAKCEAPTE
jgi:hypothetical protein